MVGSTIGYDDLSEVMEEDEVKEPPLYKVIIHNDDYTSMDFVVSILIKIFHKSNEEAEKIMLLVHYTGFGVCGLYPKEIAETKVAMVHNTAKSAGFPLKASMDHA